MPKHSYGLVHDSTRDYTRDYRFSHLAAKLGLISLPPKVDLRPKCSPVRDQGPLGSCTGFAIATGLRECLLIGSGRAFVEVSPLFVYYMERLRERSVSQDAGAQIRDGMKVLLHSGVAPEADWPYVPAEFAVVPSAQAFQDALRFTITAAYRANNPVEIKQALSIGHPVVIGIEVFDSFESEAVARTGVVPIPDQANENYLGGHAVCVVGYDDADKTFLVKNSWGTGWGMAGYFTLPYGYFASALGLTGDMWTAVP